jgi:two-component system, cell cycle sensor histidine kinase and response regulator CckA
VGTGTEFRIFLACEETKAPIEPAPEPVKGASSRGETVLVVEDESLVRATTCNILRKAGYRVIEASSAQAALDAWNAARDHIDLVFTDIVMPGGLSGLELMEQLRREKPSLRALFTSGYSAELTGTDFQRSETNAFLQKPFGISELKAAVAACIGSGA